VVAIEIKKLKSKQLINLIKIPKNVNKNVKVKFLSCLMFINHRQVF
jgi:hypothetical protein